MQHPDCHRSAEECRVMRGSYIKQPLIEWRPIYDGEGRQVNSDPNTVVDYYMCSTCAGEWEQSRVAGGPPEIKIVQPIAR